MVISPNDFSLWARLTGNKYPSTPAERAKKGPEVYNFIQNLDKEGMLGGKEPEQPKKEKNLAEKIATGALIAGGVAATVAAGRDPRVQDIAKKAASATKTKIDDFLSNLGKPRVIDVDVIDAGTDITPDPIQQQTNVAPAQLVGAETYKPAVEGKTFGTSGAVSKLEDIGDAELRARRTYSPMIDAIQQKNPGINVENMKKTMLAKAEKDRDYDIAYMVAKGQGKTDETATQIARSTAGFSTDSPVGKPTPYREFLGEQRTSSIRKESIDNLLKLVEPGPQINLPESVQEPGALVQLAAGSTPSNKVPTMGATIGGSSLTDKHATKMAVDNALDNVRAKLTGTPVPITGVTSTGLKTSIQDDNLRRIAPTPEQAQAIREEPGRVSRTFDEMTGFTAPKSETISTNPLEERISRLEGKTAELRAIQENLGRAGELMSTGLDPRTTRFDSARAAGLTSKSGIKPRITNPRFQENMNLGKVQEAAIPESSGRVFFEQDSEGRVIPETVERRSERKVVRGPDTKTRRVAGG